ncbi:MAG TPA: AAC(3) family N-acetyltransferase [Byssovorax sp.]
MRTWTEREVAEQLTALGVRRGVVLVHTSFRAVRPIDGGPLGLLRALRAALGDDGTLVMPTMSDGARAYDPRITPSVDMGGGSGDLFAASGRRPQRQHRCRDLKKSEASSIQRLT